MTKKTTREACRLANEEGDQTLCEQENCPWYGDPDGCNHPTRNRDEAPYGNAASLRNALLFCLPRIKAMRDDALGDSGGILVDDLVYESCCNMFEKIEAALAEPARNCDRFRNELDAQIAYIKEHPHEDEPDANTYGGWLLHTEEKHD